MKFTLFLLHLITLAFALESKMFEKKAIKISSLEAAETKSLLKTSSKIDKIICSNLCLKDVETCVAFYINEDHECLMIRNPEILQENRKDCLGTSSQIIWTTKNPKPAFTEYVMVSSGWVTGMG